MCQVKYPWTTWELSCELTGRKCENHSFQWGPDPPLRDKTHPYVVTHPLQITKHFRTHHDEEKFHVSIYFILKIAIERLKMIEKM